MIPQPVWNFEQEPYPHGSDETDINLRAYFDRMDDEKMRSYQRGWSDDQLIEWDGNFKDDGSLMIACSERDVEIGEYREVLHECIAYRDRFRGKI